MEDRNYYNEVPKYMSSSCVVHNHGDNCACYEVYCAYCGKKIVPNKVGDHYEFMCDCADAQKEIQIVSRIEELSKQIQDIELKMPTTNIKAYDIVEINNDRIEKSNVKVDYISGIFKTKKR